jgi:endonuclease/exonuclease/phosphatase family metal-dependent hydrolase
MPASEKLRVITYNIRKGKGAHGGNAVEMATLGGALALHQADIVMCQEVFHCSRGRGSQSELLAEALKLHSYYGGNKFHARGHHGNTTFSRLPAEHSSNHDISTNRIERRGMLYVRLALDQSPLHVINVHLGLNAYQRRAQVRRVAELIETQAKPDEPVLLAGDFNDWNLELDRVIVQQLSLHNAFADLADPAAAILSRTWHARRPIFNLDRIYVRHVKAVEARRLDGGSWQELSDHLPLMADLSRT